MNEFFSNTSFICFILHSEKVIYTITKYTLAPGFTSICEFVLVFACDEKKHKMLTFAHAKL